MLQRLWLCSLICTAIACAQVTSSSVTVTASRTTNLQPDQVVFGVTVTTPLTGTRDDALNALGGSGITLANLTGVITTTLYPQTNVGSPQTVLQWTFSLPVSISDMKTTVALLSSVAQGLAKKNNGLSISFGVQATQVSAQLQQSMPCPVAGLISDARAQAQTMAGAANINLGSILAMSSPTSAGATCSLTVKFAAFPY
jgi:uncharacterized protein YggE